MEANTFQNLQTTGIPALDVFLGGGWVKGALTELHGKRGGGKLTLALQTAAGLTQARKWVALISQGNLPFPPAWAHEGVDLHYLLWVRPKPLEHCRWALEQVTRSGLFPLILAVEIALPEALSRRLQLAAEKQGVTVLLLTSSPSPCASFALAARFHVERSESHLKFHVIKSRKYLSQPFMEVSLHGPTNLSSLLTQPSSHKIAS